MTEDEDCEIYSVATSLVGVGNAMQSQRACPILMRCGDDPCLSQDIAELHQDNMTADMTWQQALVVVGVLRKTYQMLGIKVDTARSYLERNNADRGKGSGRRCPPSENLRRRLFEEAPCRGRCDEPDGDLCRCGLDIAVCGACGEGWAQRQVRAETEWEKKQQNERKELRRRGTDSDSNGVAEQMFAEASRLLGASNPAVLKPFRGSRFQFLLLTHLPATDLGMVNLQVATLL